MKKSNNNLVFYLVIFIVFICASAKAQMNVSMATNGVTAGSPFAISPPATCFFNFFDSGGAAGNYNNGADATATFIPANAATHRIRANFTSFALEVGWDAFYIYNSISVGINKVPGPEGATNSGFPGGNWQSISPGIITANTGSANVGTNTDEALTFRFQSDNTVTSPGWSAIITQVPKAVCTLVAPGPITVNTGAGSNACFVNVNTAVPTFNPGGCNASYVVQYRINGGAPTIVTVPGNTTISAPVGNNVITWELIDPCGGSELSSATQIIKVIDNTLPVISCPGNITLNLGDGGCTAAYSYNVSCNDNCGIMMAGAVSHPIDFNSGNAGVMFDVKNLGFTPMVLTEFGPSINAGSWTMQVYYTTSANSWQGHENNAGDWTQAGTTNIISTGPGAGTPIPGFGIALAPGESKGIYITSTTGAPVNYTGIGSPGVFRQYDDGKLRVSSNPGAGKTYPFGLTFQSRGYNGYVKYEAASTSQAIQISGIPSGGQFPAGVTNNIFQCTDAAGNIANCAFSVTVAPFTGAVNALTCNDLVIVALGTDCTTTVGADDVLEGGPYKCFDEYDVDVDKIPPYGNGPWVPAVLGAADIGKTYRVRVTDPTTGNKCYGDLKVQDNLAPQMTCGLNAVTVPCSYSLDPTFSAITTATLRFSASGLPQNVVDFQTRTYDIPVGLPAGATINDVDLRMKISGDAFLGNIRIELESPTGTIVKTWDQILGCSPAPIWARFDDEGSATFNCAALTTDQHAQIPQGVGLLSTFDGQLASGTWKIRVSDLDNGGDISTIETAEIFLNVTANFGTGLPNGLTMPPVTQTGANSFNVPAGLLDACSAVTLTYTDMTVPQNCQSDYSKIINRRWQAKDASGNSSTCLQTIYLLRPTYADVTFPPDYDGINAQVFECDGVYPTPDWINSQGLQGGPLVFGQPTGCTISWEYDDSPIWVCDGSYNIKRVWSFDDDCSTTLQHIQIIRVRDNTAPTFVDCPSNVTVTTDPFNCCGTVDLPEVLIADVCSQVSSITATIATVDPNTNIIIDETIIVGGVSNFPGNDTSNPDTLGVFGNAGCLSIGTHYVTYTVTDDCGNTGTCSFEVFVKDYSPPTPACDEFTVVSIGVDDPSDCYYPNPNGCEFAGVTWVKATTFDDGSYDNCNAIRFKVRRALPYSGCIQDLNACEFQTATEESDSIKFYCCEVGTSLMVILRVYQLDPNGDISLYPDGTPIFNECQVQISVQDKLKPACDPPFNVTVSCENFDPSLWVYGKPTVYDNCCLDSTKMYQGQKGLTHSVNYNTFDTVCNKGTIFRTFRAYDCHGLSSQCSQRIIVNYEQNYFIKFPDDKIVTTCDGTGLFGEPLFYGENCELLGVSFQDQVYTVVPDACYKIERTWKIINWCTYNPNLPCIEVPNPNPNATSNHASNLPGPTVSKLGTPAPWAPTVVKINPSDPVATNYSTFYEKDANCYTYKQIIKVIDTQDPIVICPASPVEICDLTLNDPKLWNESYWWNAGCATHDLCEAPADINITGTDLCSGQNINIKYLLFLDMDGDGIMETVVSSTNLPDANTVQYNNVNTVNFTGGTARAFDERAVPPNQKYRFAMQTTTSGTNVTAAVRWNTQQSPTTYTIPELPYGTHKIKWIVEDGCGNETVCEYQFIIKDCKAPTVVCINGLSANVMATGITLFVSDFLLDSYDNCTPLDFLQFGIRRSGTGTGFPFLPNGSPQSSVTFTCDDIGTQPVEIWAIDKAGNADYCETYIIVQDNLLNCPSAPGSATVAGKLKTENLDGLEESDVELAGQNPAGPTFNFFGMTDQAGAYHFANAVPMFSNYTVTPTKDDNPLNGVSTYDLVLISKHILGLLPLNTPYKMIAADANGSNSITTTDIVELRKLILGIYDELPNNTSWRFVDKSYTFPNPLNPFVSAFPENKSVADIHTNQMEDDFMAIKIGDVNSSAIANVTMNAEDRSAGTLLFDVDERKVKAGETFTVNFKATEKVIGYQFTLNYEDLDVVDLIPAGDLKTENFAMFPDNNAITTSWFGNTGAAQTEFSVRFRAKKSGDLSKMLGVSSRVTKAEAYSQDDDGRMDVAFRFNSPEGSTITGVGFELYQNQPNPFVNKTTIGFHLPEAADATLTIFDETGRRLYTQKGSFSRGYNYFPIERAMLNTTGVLYYTLETPVGSATKKMIQAK